MADNVFFKADAQSVKGSGNLWPTLAQSSPESKTIKHTHTEEMPRFWRKFSGVQEHSKRWALVEARTEGSETSCRLRRKRATTELIQSWKWVGQYSTGITKKRIRFKPAMTPLISWDGKRFRGFEGATASMGRIGGNEVEQRKTNHVPPLHTRKEKPWADGARKLVARRTKARRIGSIGYFGNTQRADREWSKEGPRQPRIPKPTKRGDRESQRIQNKSGQKHKLARSVWKIESTSVIMPPSRPKGRYSASWAAQEKMSSPRESRRAFIGSNLDKRGP